MDKQHREVRIFSDAGRILRPLLVVENLRKIRALKGGDLSFQCLLDKGIIELIGPEEEEDCTTAWELHTYSMQTKRIHPEDIHIVSLICHSYWA